MFVLAETFAAPIPKHVIGTFATADEAIAKVQSMGAVVIEEDCDNPQHFDIITKGGSILTIEPQE